MRTGKGRRTPSINDARMGIANLEHSTARGVMPLVGAMYLGHLLLVAMAGLAACALVAVHGRPLADASQSRWGSYAPLGKRTELPPCSAFPGLTQAQCDQINRAWHDFQVDLSRRSRYGELRRITGSGHLMQQQKPEAVSQAVSDVINEVNSDLKPR
jgi:hypothetical protein